MTTLLWVLLFSYALDIIYRALLLTGRASMVQSAGYVAADLVINVGLLAWICVLLFGAKP